MPPKRHERRKKTDNPVGDTMDAVSFADLRLTSTTYPRVGNEPFEVPHEVLAKPQYIFGYHVVVLYDTEDQCRQELADAFDVSTQAIWLWRREGIPSGRREQLAKVLKSKKAKLRLASNVTIDDLLRPTTNTMLRGSEQMVNNDWLDFLRDLDLGKYPGWSRPDIPKIGAAVNLTPAAVYRWGWVSGGVSPTFAPKVWHYLIGRGMHRLFNMTEEDFIAYCEAHFQGFGTRRDPD